MELTATVIAAHLGGTVEGNPEATVSDFGKIENAAPGTITFLSDPKYEHYIYSTSASVVIVSRDFVPSQPVAATLIRVDDPRAALAVLIGIAAQYIKPRHQGVEQGAYIAEGVDVPEDAYVGSMAYIAAGAKLGKGVQIYPQAYIGEGVAIGDNTVVYPGAKIYYGCRIGARCVIHAGAVIGADGFGFAPDANGVYHKIEQIGTVRIADDVEIGANTTVDRATMGETVIERGTKLDNLVQVGHNVTVGHDTVMCAQVGIAGSTHIGSHCVLAGQVGVAGHISVGDRTQLGAQSGVPNSVGEGQRLLGTPAMPAGAFARSVAYTKRLGDLFAKVDALAKRLDSIQKN